MWLDIACTADCQEWALEWRWGIGGMDCGALEMADLECAVGLDSSLGSSAGMLALVAMCVMLWGATSSGAISGAGLRLTGLLAAFGLGMGLVMLASDGLVLFFGWELIGAASILLIG